MRISSSSMAATLPTSVLPECSELRGLEAIGQNKKMLMINCLQLPEAVQSTPKTVSPDLSTVVEATVVMLRHRMPGVTDHELARAIRRILNMKNLLGSHLTPLSPWSVGADGFSEIEKMTRRVRAMHLAVPEPKLLADAITLYKKDRVDHGLARKSMDAFLILDRYLCAVGPIFVEDANPVAWLDLLVATERISEDTRKNYQITMRCFFDWCEKENFTPINPCPRYVCNRRRGGGKPIPIIPPSDVLRLLETAIWWRPIFIPILVLHFFLGLRPSRETFELTWAEIQWQSNAVQIDPLTVKKRKARRIILTPVVIAWLKPYFTGDLDAKICPITYEDWKQRRPYLYRWAGVDWTGPNAPRHTYASARVNHQRDRRAAADHCGHSVAKQISNYVRLLPPGVGARLLGINPPAGWAPTRARATLV